MEIEGIKIKSRWHELHVRLWLGVRDIILRDNPKNRQLEQLC